MWEIKKQLNEKHPVAICLCTSGGNRTHTPERTGF